jgi:hypothetical protein
MPKDTGILTCDKWFNSWNKKWDINVWRKRGTVKNKLARKLTDNEKLKIVHLGTMRIWSLKNKILKL